MRKTAAILCVLALIMIVQLSIMSARAFEGSIISSPLSSKPVTIDGRWTTPDEWSDASLTVIPVYRDSALNGTGCLYAKHNATDFFFLVDFVSATQLIPSSDYASITIDSLHNDGNSPQTDDRRFNSQYHQVD